MQKIMHRNCSILFCVLLCLFGTICCLQMFDFDEIVRETFNTCFVVGIGLKQLSPFEPVETAVSRTGDTESEADDAIRITDTLEKMRYVFSDESTVRIGWTLKKDLQNMKPMSHKKHYQYDSLEFDGKSYIAVISRSKRDHTCLLPTPLKVKPSYELYTGPMKSRAVTDFVNHYCEVFRSSRGRVLPEKYHKDSIMQNLFKVESVSSLTMGQLYKTVKNPFNTSFSWGCEENCKSRNDNQANQEFSSKPGKANKQKTNLWIKQNQIPQCERIPMPSKQDFFHNFLKTSHPVVIQGGALHWKAMQKWTMDFFKQEYGDRDIHIKLAPDGIFEGVENADQWDDYKTFKMPSHVKSQLEHPELVVVRPAYTNMKLKDFIDLIQNKTYLEENVSAYLEYSSIPDHLPELESDIQEFSFVKGMLRRKHLNIWLSSGNTVGKLHFDPFDNLLCQLSGTKEVIMFEPFNNTQLYEAHIPEAMLSYNKVTRSFRRKTLKDSTSMVMSPVDITKPDVEKFPAFQDARPINCTISEGDVLFMPAFWWHEVISQPSKDGRNLAVNYWYEPFLTKEFPCPECPLDVNVKEYRHLL